jgi:hypothetical protein
VSIPTTQRLVRVGAFLDGNGSTDADQVLRGVVYRDGRLVAAGEDVTVRSGQTADWVTFPFDVAGLVMAAADYQFGIQAGFISDGARYYISDLAGGVSAYDGDPYTTGPPAELGAGTRTPFAPLMFMETSSGVLIRDGVSDAYIATLPFELTQRMFLAGGWPQMAVSAVAGWYGRSFDPAQGANAIVRADGELSTLEGKRILVTRRGATHDRHVAVYVHATRAFPDELADEDLVLSARAFLALGDQALDALDVTVGVLR